MQFTQHWVLFVLSIIYSSIRPLQLVNEWMIFISGLQPSYVSDVGSGAFMRKLIALPLLPSEHMQPAFDKLVADVTEPRLLELTTYIQNTWLQNSVWSVDSICVFRQTIRTNNDVEGWHRRLNHRAQRGRLSLYLLIRLLFGESRFVTVQLTLLSEGKLKRASRKKFSHINSELSSLWDRYEGQQISTSKLLRRCSRLTLPFGNWTDYGLVDCYCYVIMLAFDCLTCLFITYYNLFCLCVEALITIIKIIFISIKFNVFYWNITREYQSIKCYFVC